MKRPQDRDLGSFLCLSMVEACTHKYVIPLAAVVALVAAPGVGVAAGCSANHYETTCNGDSSCQWDSKKSKCTKKDSGGSSCSKHAEFYCEVNGCHWDTAKRECTDKKS
jgi:hypothetical protein